ncbi:MAG: endonuclease/exonuclease/phosphatase family protein, partial [Candidatus Kariarchaeaceae archaeon]
THLPLDEDSDKVISGKDRIDQIADLMEYITSYDVSNSNIILIGDFNSLSNFTEITQITDVLVDGWNETSPNLPGYTFPSDNADRRIDYLFFSGSIAINSCSVPITTVSDHLPVWCDITVS